MTKINDNDLVLVKRQYDELRKHRRAILWSLAAVGLAALLALTVFAHQADAETWQRLLRHLQDRFDQRPLILGGQALLIVLSLLGLIYQLLNDPHEQLIVRASGIEYRGGLPAPLSGLRRGWHLNWGQIHGAELYRHRGLSTPYSQVRVKLDNTQRKIKLAPLEWVDPSATQQAVPFLRLNAPPKPAAIKVLLHQHPLLLRLQSHLSLNLDRIDDLAKSSQFALEKNRASLIALWFGGIALAYLALDFFLQQESYVTSAPWPILLPVALGVSLIAVVALLKGRVPAAETSFLALLLGVIGLGSFYFLALRINQWSDREGLMEQPYVMQTPGRFEPKNDASLPSLRFDGYSEYWSSLAVDSEHLFALRRGGLGFYQIDMAPIHTAMRNYYRSK